MTLTAEPRDSAAEASPPPSALDRAEGVELLGDVHGSGYERGAALVRRADGQMVQLGPLMYALLECVDGRRSLDDLAACMTERLGKRFDAAHVQKLAEKLAAQGLLAGTEQYAPPRRNPLLALHFKVLVTNPRATRLLTLPFSFLFSPLIVVPVAVLFVLSFWFTLIHKGIASGAAQAFDRPGLLLLVFVLAVASAGLHELGHAAACRYGGATPGGMGMGLYMVWPAFYTDVTDSYRLPKADRLRVDLGGIYFNALIAVATTGAWLVWHVDALLLLVALQFLMIVKNLSPVIRSDGYHILADTTGIPDLYAHIGPTLKRLIPWHHAEPSALRGRARALVTAWVLVVVPVLLSLMVGAVVLLPRMVTSAWDSGRVIVSAMPHESAMSIGADCLRLVALVLPVVGSILVGQRILRMLAGKAMTWSEGRPTRQAMVVGLATAATAGAAWVLWPAGQYQPVRPGDDATLVSFTQAVAHPQSVARPQTAPAAVVLAPGRHLAVSMIPVGGATRRHPAVFFIPASEGKPAVAVISTQTPDPADAPTSTSTQSSPTSTATSTQPASAPVQVNAFPFKLPSAPGPGDSQALAVNHTNGGVTYDVAYSLVTVGGGANVTNTNSAFAFANCTACTTVAVSFQVVLVIGQSKNIAPINAAGALNVDCPACLTTAIADQIVVTLTAAPTPELVRKLEAALQQLNAISALGANGTPAAVAAQVAAVQKEIDDALQASGQLANSPTQTSTESATTTPATTTAPAATPTTPTTTAQAPATTTTTPATTTTQAATTTDPTTSTGSTTTDSTTSTESTTTTESTSTTETQTTTTGG